MCAAWKKTCCIPEEQTGLDIMKQDSGNTGERGLWETWLVQTVATSQLTQNVELYTGFYVQYISHTIHLLFIYLHLPFIEVN